MSLNWNFSRCEGLVGKDGQITDKEVLKWKDILIWTAMAVDLGEITYRNLGKWIQRIKQLNEAGRYMAQVTEDGKSLHGVNVPVSVLLKCVGFSTNCISRSDREFTKSLKARKS